MAVSAATIARRRRAPLMALAVVALFAGLWGGLIRLGLSLPHVVTSAGEAHGPLMALGFLGTLVSLERAVALDRPWAYVAPLAAGTGALAGLGGASDSFAPALLTLAGSVLLAEHAGATSPPALRAQRRHGVGCARLECRSRALARRRRRVALRAAAGRLSGADDRR